MTEPEPARPYVSAGAVFVDDDGRVLLVDPTYKDFWNLPGGGVDAGETPLQACVREVREELALTPLIGRLLVTAWTPAKLFFVFDGGVLPADQRAAIRVAEGELAQHAFVTLEQAGSMLSPALLGLMSEVIEARTEGTTRYVELG